MILLLQPGSSYVAKEERKQLFAIQPYFKSCFASSFKNSAWSFNIVYFLFQLVPGGEYPCFYVMLYNSLKLMYLCTLGSSVDQPNHLAIPVLT